MKITVQSENNFKSHYVESFLGVKGKVIQNFFKRQVIKYGYEIESFRNLG